MVFYKGRGQLKKKKFEDTPQIRRLLQTSEGLHKISRATPKIRAHLKNPRASTKFRGLHRKSEGTPKIRGLPQNSESFTKKSEDNPKKPRAPPNFEGSTIIPRASPKIRGHPKKSEGSTKFRGLHQNSEGTTKNPRAPPNSEGLPKIPMAPKKIRGLHQIPRASTKFRGLPQKSEGSTKFRGHSKIPRAPPKFRRHPINPRAFTKFRGLSPRAKGFSKFQGLLQNSKNSKNRAVPMLNQVTSATRGATDAFSGVSRHVNDSLRKLGAKNIEAGVGCGVGFGHGFGVGLAVKPGVLHQIQSCLVQSMTKMMLKFGISPSLPIGQGALPVSFQSGMSMMNQSLNQNPMESIMQLGTKLPEDTSQGLPGYGNIGSGSTYENFASKGTPIDSPFGSRTEKVISSFLQNPVLEGEGTELNDLAGRLRSENNMLQMVLKHQQLIEELMEENEKVRQVLLGDLKIPPSKLQAAYSSKNKSLCTDCFECRRKQRKSR